MTSWQEVKLGDVCSSISETYHRKDASVVLVNTSDVLEGKILNHELVKNEKLKGQFKKTFKKDDILYSEIRPANKRFAYVDFDYTSNYIASTKLMVLRPNKEKILPKFLFNILKSEDIISELQHLAETRSGTFPQITFSSELAPMEILLPPLEIQKKIAGVLGALDDKIELNNKINNNLEQQAQALFNEKIVNNSKQGCIGDYCSIKSGFAFKSSWWQNTGVRVIKIKNIEPSGLNLQECSFVLEDKVSIAKEFIVKGGDLLIAMTGATIGKFAIVPHVDEILLVNQRVGKFFLGDNPLEKLPFIYCTLKQPEVVSEIINRGQGSAQPNISGNDIMSITCNYPDENIIAGFNNICRPYFEKIITNQYENTRLAAIRDALLPKLMSGEIDVSNVDISALTSTDKLSFSEENK